MHRYVARINMNMDLMWSIQYKRSISLAGSEWVVFFVGVLSFGFHSIAQTSMYASICVFVCGNKTNAVGWAGECVLATVCGRTLELSVGVWEIILARRHITFLYFFDIDFERKSGIPGCIGSESKCVSKSVKILKFCVYCDIVCCYQHYILFTKFRLEEICMWTTWFMFKITKKKLYCAEIFSWFYLFCSAIMDKGNLSEIYNIVKSLSKVNMLK